MSEIERVTELFSFSDSAWRPFAPDKLDELGVTPNELWHHAIAEYAMSQVGLVYIVDALRTQKIEGGIVVLSRSDGARRSVVTVRPVADVVTMLDGIPPREGPLGPYWWLNPDCSAHGVRPLSKEEIPF